MNLRVLPLSLYEAAVLYDSQVNTVCIIKLLGINIKNEFTGVAIIIVGSSCFIRQSGKYSLHYQITRYQHQEWILHNFGTTFFLCLILWFGFNSHLLSSRWYHTNSTDLTNTNLGRKPWICAGLIQSFISLLYTCCLVLSLQVALNWNTNLLQISESRDTNCAKQFFSILRFETFSHIFVRIISILKSMYESWWCRSPVSVITWSL